MKLDLRFACIAVIAHASSALLGASTEIGMFTDHGDVGRVVKSGAVEFDQAAGTYTVTGGGDNMWATNDAFHYVWKRVSGDVALAADIRWPTTGGNAHRKACLVIRQTLDADSVYADAALHGDGLTSLQCRETAGGATHEIQANVSAPGRLRVEKRGNYVSISVGATGGPLELAGGAYRVEFKEPFYIGLAVCAHDNSVAEKAVFSKVELTTLPPVSTNQMRVESTLEVVPIGSKDRRVVYHTRDRIEAPNWTRDGQLVFNRGGHLFKIPVVGGQPRPIDTGSASRINNDHGISPDGTEIAISDQSSWGSGPLSGGSRVYVLPSAGGTPRRVTGLAPSYFHGWSPDGKTIVFCAQRNGEFDVYTIPSAGGPEKRLTTAPGLDDGPEFSPDGQFIYFNSDRTGTMQIWRMKPDGSGQEQVTADDYNNWFAHPSPDGRWLVFISFSKDVSSSDHPANKDVVLRLKPLRGGEIQVLAKLFGGQGTINAPSWSPDSQRLAFVSYQTVVQ